MKIGVLTDSTCDIPDELRKKYNIEVIPLYVLHEGKTYRDNELEWEDFSRMLKSENPPTTSQPNIDDFIEKYNEMLQKYDHIIGIFISSLLSGTYNTAITASTLIEEPQKITIIDSKGGTLAMAMMAIEIAKKAKEGNINETIKFAEEIVKKGEIYFMPSDMKHLKKSGRIGAAQSLIIGLLNVKLILRAYEGKLVLFKKTIGAKKAMNMLYDIIRSKDILNKMVGLSVTGDFEQTGEIVSKIKEMGLNVIVEKMSNVLATHGGPNLFAISFLIE